MKDNIDLIKRLNKTIVHDDGTFDSFEKQLLNLSGGIFDVTKPLIVSPDSSSISYFEESIDKPITMRVNTALKIREKHEIGYAFVGQCLDLLRGSVLAFESLTQENSMVVLLDDFNVDNDPYIAICRMDRLMNAVEVNEITSVYDKQNFEKFLVRSYDAGKHFYKNKKTEQYIKSQRLQLPKEMIFALSDAYYKPSFTKSQVEVDIKSNNILSVRPALSNQIQPTETCSLKAVNIDWDVDSETERDSLPSEIEIPEGMEDEEDISDYLSDVTGFCHKGFRLVDCSKEAARDMGSEPAKLSLSDQIQSASTRVGDSHASPDVPVKSQGPEH